MCLISSCHTGLVVYRFIVLGNVVPLLYASKLASDKMHQIIEVYPNWHVYADVFKHPPHRLAS